VLDIARVRKIATTAEGVETRQQRDRLLDLGCMEMQGYYCSPAVTASKAALFLSNGVRREKGEGRREKGEGRREKGEGRRKKEEQSVG
jgi:predicted signal transduction protein with EAL and GGDEF domain